MGLMFSKKFSESLDYMEKAHKEEERRKKELEEQKQMEAEQKSTFQGYCESSCKFIVNAGVEHYPLGKVGKYVVNSVTSNAIKSNINSNNFGHSGHVQNIHDVKRSTQNNFDKVALTYDDVIQDNVVNPMCESTCKELDRAITNPYSYASEKMNNFSIPAMTPSEAYDCTKSFSGSGGNMFNFSNTDCKW